MQSSDSPGLGWEETQAQLSLAIKDGDILGQADLINLMNAEAAYGESAINHSRGFALQVDALQALWMSTINSLATSAVPSGKARFPWSQASMLLDLLALFRVYRQSQRGFWGGYGVESVPQLRSVLEFSLLLAGAAHGVCSMADSSGREAFGHSPIESDQSRQKVGAKAARLRKEALSRVQKEVERGETVGLTEQEKLEWRRWRDSFNLHAHGSVLSRGKMKADWLFDGRPPAFLEPLAGQDLQTTYINTCVQVSWLMLRVLPLCRSPFMSPEGSTAWVKAWRLTNAALEASIVERETRSPKAAGMLRKVACCFFDFDPESFSNASLVDWSQARESSGEGNGGLGRA